MRQRTPALVITLALAGGCGLAAMPAAAPAATSCRSGTYRITERTHVTCTKAKSVLASMRNGWTCRYPSLNHVTGSCRGPGGARFRFHTATTGPTSPPATPAPNVPAVP